MEYRAAHRALRAGDVQRAGMLFTSALKGKALSARDESIAQLFKQLAEPGADTAAVKAALQRLAAPG
jgi:SOS response regulatory protein OraA/RecX